MAQRAPDHDPYAAAPDRGERDPFWDYRTLAVAKLLVTVLQALPAGMARWLGRSAGRMLHKIDKRHRKQSIQHMALAYRDELSMAQKEAICRGFFEHMGLAAVEFARLPLLTRENMHEIVDWSALSAFDPLLAKGKGMLCVPAHHGNWELCGYAAALLGYPLKSVARPIDNPALNEYVTQIREKSGNHIIEKWRVLWKLKKLLDKGGIVTMSVDQNGGVAGEFVPFFGVMASTVASPADLHLATGAPIVVATLNRQPDGIRHKFHIWDTIEFKRTGDRNADVKAILTRINQAFEKSIRMYPEQWLWMHKRWKTRPAGEVVGADGFPPRVASPV